MLDFVNLRRDRSVPQSVESEQSVIGSLLLDNDSVDRVGFLKTEHFYRGDHRMIFSEVISMIDGGISADALTVSDRLQAKGRLSEVGGLAYLNALAQNTPSAANICRYAEIVLDRFRKRSLLGLAEEIRDSVGAVGDSAAVLMDKVAGRIDSLGIDYETKETRLASEWMASHIDVLERRSDGRERVIQTGLEAFDKQLCGGLRRGWVTILAARPGMGKTALAMNLATCISESKVVLFLSMEMPVSELNDRNLSSLGSIPLERVMRSSPDDYPYWNRVTQAVERIRKLKLHIDDQSGLTLLAIRMKARKIKRKYGLDVLIIDYIQLMSGNGENENDRLQTISRGLKALAKELDISVITLAQLNRKVEERTNRLPQLSDLRGSGAIEQDADVVLFLHREEVSNPQVNEQWKGFAQVRCAKFRHGPTGNFALKYNGEFMRFENYEGSFPSNEEMVNVGSIKKRGYGFK